MRILITGTTGDSMPPPYGGIPKVSLLYGGRWKRMGHDVALTFVYRPENSDDFGANARYFFEYAQKPSKRDKILFLLKYAVRNPILYLELLFKYLAIYPKLQTETLLYSAYGVYMNSVIADYKPDVILGEAALIKTFMVAVIANKKCIPLVIDTYAEVKDPLMGVNKHLSEAGRKKYWMSYLSRAELILGISNCTVGAFNYGPEGRVKEFYDCCDFSRCAMYADSDRIKLRDALKLPHDIFLCGAVGAFEARKGHDHLIRAVGILKGQGKDVGAAICGGSGDVEKWRELARDEGVEDCVFFFSRLSEEDLVRFLRSLDVYTNLSNSDRSCGLDLALLEGMACGKPIIVYNTGGLPAAVEKDKNGYVVEKDNTEKVAEMIEKLMMLSSGERHTMGKESIRIAKKCDIDETAKIKISWLKEVVAKHK